MTQIYIHPDRKPLKRKPLVAYKHMQNLIADKEDTEQVFHIIEALNGNALERDLRSFAKTPEGERAMADRFYIPDVLDNHEYLKTLPVGSVGRAYQNFMEREGLSAAGLVAETDKFWKDKPRFEDDIEWYGDMRRDTHDMLHIMSGYGRDALGEACVLNFTVGQHGGMGAKFIAIMAGRQIKKLAPRGTPIRAALKEASRNGKAAQVIARTDIRDLIKEDLNEARERLGIKPPTQYELCWDMFKAAGMEPATA